ncbi:hypothetical protein GJ496_012062 [Pomphorhynchus laevis]|nr:hypothetical protein GJ496_012062 [Pomphorhynchus laevis]
MTKHAWDSYAANAMGANEFRPISITGHNTEAFGTGHTLGAFVVDSLDTLMIMGLENEAQHALHWISDNFQPGLVTGYVSVFEVNIRILGGLLGGYSLSDSESNRKILIKASIDLANRLLNAYDTEGSNLPYSLVNLHTGSKKCYDWSRNCIILSEAGSLQLEMDYLSHITGDRKYSDIARNSTKALLDRFNGNNYIPISKSDRCRTHVSIGAMGDSFYEYLLKIELLSSNKDNTKRFTAFLSCLNTIEEQTLKDSTHATYFCENNGHIDNVMGHLACFTGGMYALSSIAKITDDPVTLVRFERLARNITWTCRQSYLLGGGIGPETFRVQNNGKLSQSNPSYYILRPEYAESLFYLYKLTGDTMYQDWAWDMVLQIEKRCKVKGGYASLNNVFMDDGAKDDNQHTFFIAETLKYLYLIFEDKINLHEYVFNTEAHPFKII